MPGLWEGRFELRPPNAVKGQTPSGAGKAVSPGDASATSGQTLSGPMSLTLLESGFGALLDLPAQSMFGFPLYELSWRADRISFKLRPGSEMSTISFNGFLSNAQKGNPPRIVGNCRSEGFNGTFSLDPVPARLAPGETLLSIETGMGRIPGSLRMPLESQAPVPLVIMIAASGATDRNGNNFNVPGKNDALRMLADELARAGIASYRFDKRGSGEAYRLVYDESFLRFYQYVDDAAEIISHFRVDRRFSRVVLFCHAEGALVGAAALNRLGEFGTFVDAVMMVCASDKSPLQGLREALADTPPALRDEAELILDALQSGSGYPSPSTYFADFFRPSFWEYLSSWIRYDPRLEIPSIAAPVSFVHGGRDLQVSMNEFEGLISLLANPSAHVLPGMNHTLKEVSEDADGNYDAFTDPSFPLGRGLVDLVASFAAGKDLPLPTQLPGH